MFGRRARKELDEAVDQYLTSVERFAQTMDAYVESQQKQMATLVEIVKLLTEEEQETSTE